MSAYEVIVAGGGVSGSIAAIASARAGARTLIIESGGFMGGTLTSAGVGPMMTFHAGHKQAIQGIIDELIQRLQAIGKSPGHIPDATNYTYSVTPFDAEAMKYELDLMLQESGGNVLYHTMLAGAKVEQRRIHSLILCNKSGLSEMQADVFVDATGDGDLATWSGVPFQKGRESDEMSQPMTLKMKMRNVNITAVKEYIKAHREEFPRMNLDISVMDSASRLSVIGFERQFQQAKERGEISIPREDILFFETNNPGEVIMNTTRILGKDSTNAQSLSEAEIEGRKQCRELELFMKKYIPGFEQSIVVSTGPSIGVRGSRQIQGVYTLTAQDILQMKKFDDVIAHSGYPIDIHSPDGEGTATDQLEWGGMYGIPYRSLITNEIDNLIVVGRCLSATFEAQAAVRTTPTVGAIGQAGGTAAALAVQYHIPVQQVNIQQLQQMLQQQKAYLEV